MKPKLSIETIDTCGYPRISTAPAGWAEDPNLYASIDDEGIIWLVRNPASWEMWTDDKGRTFRRRPKPIPLHDAPPKASAARSRAPSQSDIADRLLSQAEGAEF